MSTVLMILAMTVPLTVANMAHRRAVDRARSDFLARARQVAPEAVWRGYDAALVPWAFWRWARAVDDAGLTDPELLRHAGRLRALRRNYWLHVPVTLAVVFVVVALAFRN